MNAHGQTYRPNAMEALAKATARTRTKATAIKAFMECGLNLRWICLGFACDLTAAALPRDVRENEQGRGGFRPRGQMNDLNQAEHLFRRAAWRLIPVMALMYVVSFL